MKRELVTGIMLTLLLIGMLTLAFNIKPARAEPATIMVIGPWPGAERDAFMPVLQAFEEKSGIDVEYKMYRAEDLATLLPAQFDNGTTPGDVIFMWPWWITQQAQNGHILEVTDLIDEADFLPGALDLAKVGDTLYGGAWTGSAKPGFWYRKSFFEAQGLTPPTTWAEFVALLEVVTAIPGIVNPIVSGDGVGWPLSDVAEHFLITFGGPQLHRDLINGTVAWNSPSVRTIFADRLVPLLEASYFSEPIEWTTALNLWWEGNYGLYFMGSWVPVMVEDPEDLGVFCLPGAEGFIFHLDYSFVPVYTEHPKEAKELFEFLASEEAQSIRVAQGGNIATNIHVPLDAYPPVDKEVAEIVQGKEVLPDLDDMIGGDFQGAFWNQLKLLWVTPGELDNVLAALQAAAMARPIYIRADGSVDPPTVPISSVDNITYTFTGNIDESIVIERDNIVVDGACYVVQGKGGGTGIDLSYRHNVTLRNAEIVNFTYGIYLGWSSDNTLIGNNVSSNDDSGILFYHSGNNTVAGNNASSNGFGGISLVHSSGSNISGNIITLNEASGIEHYHSYDSIIYGNEVTLNKHAGIWLVDSRDNAVNYNMILDNNWQGILLGDESDRNAVLNNVVSDNGGDGVVLTFSNDNRIEENTVTSSIYACIHLINSKNSSLERNIVSLSQLGIVLHDSSNYNTIQSNRVAHNQEGILLDSSNGNTIYANEVVKNGNSIRLHNSSYNEVSHNNASINDTGIVLDTSSNNNTLIGNNVASNYGGIRLDHSCNNTIAENIITNNHFGMLLSSWSSSNSISGNIITNNEGCGISLSFSSNNDISGNSIKYNRYGINLYYSGNIIYHNNFVGNTEQVDGTYRSSCVWDDGYPSGGNYWSDHITVDDFSGVDQDQPGSDGIVDEPYVIDEWPTFNRDNYPLVKPWSPIISATIDVDPDTLNLKSKGQWVTCYIELPEAYNVSDIDVSTVMLNGTIPVSLLEVPAPQPVPTEVGDYDNDAIPDLMVKFPRAEVASWIYSGLGIQYGNVILPITGEVDGTPFEGACTIKVLFPGDADDDGDVDFDDFTIFVGCYGMSIENPSFNPLADFDEDGYIKYNDFLILAGNYGKTAV